MKSRMRKEREYDERGENEFSGGGSSCEICETSETGKERGREIERERGKWPNE